MKCLTTGVLSFLAVTLLACAVWAQPPKGGRQGPPGGGREGGPGRDGAEGMRAGARPPMHPLIMALDANKDGEISAEEINNATAALKKLDKNGDGKLTRDELRPEGAPGFGGPGQGRFGQGRGGSGQGGGFGGPGRGGSGGPGRGGPGGPGGGGFAERLMGLDADEDGKVTKGEAPERMQHLFERADLNQDGAIDKGEADKLAQQFAQARGGRGGRGDGARGDRPAGKERPQRPPQ